MNYFLASIDLKAFDSIDRKQMIETLQKLGFEDELLRSKIKLYRYEICDVYWNGREMCSIERNKGIRQGCRISPLLFVLCMNEALKELNKKWKEKNTLMYVDDIIITAKSMEKINLFQKLIKEQGLEINEEKSKLIILNNKKEYERINNILIEKEIKYLGVKITNKGKIYKKHISEKIEKANRMINWIWAVTQEKLFKPYWSKVIWKAIVLPIIIYGCKAIPLTKGQLERIGIIQNKVLRIALNMPKRTAVVYLRGEIGIASVTARHCKNKLELLRHCFQNTMKLKNLINENWNEKIDWIEKCKMYLDEIKIDKKIILEITKKELKKHIDVIYKKMERRYERQKKFKVLYRDQRKIRR